MRSNLLLLLSFPILTGCGTQAVPPDRSGSLAEARLGFKTKLVRWEREKVPVAEPPSGLFRIVHYDSPVGEFAAYLSPPPPSGGKHPAILWLSGGFSNSIGETAWVEALPENDQSASAFRRAGILMMYPSLRGGNENPGLKEAFFGEVDDVLAAADYLASQDFVDPERIYLGGHSTGGTLALLVAASTTRFRAVFSFGPADEVGGYGDENLPFDLTDVRELDLRSPRRWMSSIRCPVFVFEGSKQPGNVRAVRLLSRMTINPIVHFHVVIGADHFSILAPLAELIASKILGDN